MIQVVFLLILQSVASDRITSEFAKSYFADRTIHHIAIFACWDSQDSFDFSRSIMNLDTAISYHEINDDLKMESILKVNYYKLGVIVDFDCPRSQILFEQFWEQRLRYNESYWWLIITSKESVPETFLGTLPLNIATEMTMALRRNDSYDLHDVYNPSHRHGGRLNVTFMGDWNPVDGLNIVLTQYKYKRRGNLFGLTLNSSIAISHTPKPDFETFISNPIDIQYDTMHRFNYGLIVQLRDYYNFTINMMRGTTWGYKINGTYNGILGDMVKGIIDISTTPLNYKEERLDVAEFTVQGWMVDIALIFRHPQKNDLINVFLKPFTPEVWKLIAVVAIINWFLLYLSVKVEQYYDSRDPANTLDTHPASETGLITAASICQQGLSEGPRIFSGRIVFFSLFMWALLMYQFYSASIVGSLLVEAPRFINTPEDVLHSNLEVGAEDIAYNHDFFRTTEDPVVKKIFDKKMAITKNRPKLGFYSPQEGMQKVQQGGFAFQIDTATAYKFIDETFKENEICDLVELHLLAPRHTSTGVAKHSSFKKMVTYGLRLIMERGTPKRLNNIWKHRRPQCPESHSTTPVPVMIEEFIPALILLLFGIGVSLFIMLIETLASRKPIHPLITDECPESRNSI